MEDKNGVFTFVLIIIVGMFGAIAKYISTITNKKFYLMEFFSNIFVAVFISLLVALICVHFKIPTPLACVASGVICYTGHKVVDILFDKGTAKIEKSIDDELDNI
jgi:small basic protein